VVNLYPFVPFHALVHQHLVQQSSLCSIWHTLHFLILSNHTCGALLFTRNDIWRWTFQFLLATKDLQLFCTLLLWMNVKWITTISLLQQKLKQFLLMMETNCFNMVYLNFILQCQHFHLSLLPLKCSA